MVFILDSLDELPIDKMPDCGILASNDLFSWPHSKIVITCRSECLVSISYHYETDYRAHLLNKRPEKKAQKSMKEQLERMQEGTEHPLNVPSDPQHDHAAEELALKTTVGEVFLLPFNNEQVSLLFSLSSLPPCLSLLPLFISHLISGIPVLHMEDSSSIVFTHKSLQEYFTMRAWRDESLVLPAGI
jgi:hypothetical protein